MRPMGKQLILSIHAASPKCYLVSVLVLCLHVINLLFQINMCAQRLNSFVQVFSLKRPMESQSHQDPSDQIINTQVNVCLLKDERASQTYVLVP
jgi:hypothetical protein